MARSKFIYIETPSGLKLYLDSVAEVNHTLSGSATQYAVEAGFVSSDHYTQNMDTIQLSGVISKVKIMESEETTSSDTFIKTMTALKNSGKPFTISFSNILTPFKNCLFDSLSIRTNSSTGVYAYEIDASITVLKIAQQAETVNTPTPLSEFNDVVDDKSKTNSNSFEPDEDKATSLAQIGRDISTDDSAARKAYDKVFNLNKKE